MATVNFTLRNKNYHIACDEGEQKRILELVDKLNVRVDSMSKTCISASDNVVLALTALMMEDEIDSLRNKIEEQSALANNDSSILDKKISSDYISKKEHNEIVNNTLSDALEPISIYLENLANKIKTG